MINKRPPFYPDDSDYNTNAPSYYDDLARKSKLIQLLAKRIWEYDKKLNETLEDIESRIKQRFSEWDGRIESFPDNVESLLKDWISDGTLDQIINETIFNMKADQTALDETNRQLTQSIKVNAQTDFTKVLERTAFTSDVLSVACVDKDKHVYSVVFETGNDRAIEYTTDKSSVYDYILLNDGRVGDIKYVHVEHNRLNPDTQTGKFTVNGNNQFTEEVGATFTKTFTGSGLDFFHYEDNRGGIWEFVVDGGNPIRISTYGTSTNPRRKEVFRSSEVKERTVVATFKGADPNNTPSGGTARGWVYVNTGGHEYDTFTSYLPIKRVSADITPLYGTSNKEFAINMRKAGTDNPNHFTPDHNGIPTTNIIEPPRTYIDGVERTLHKGEMVEHANEFKLVQVIYGKNPETTDNLVKATTVHTFKRGQVSVTGKVEFLTDVTIQQGYGIMFPISNQFASRILTSLEGNYQTKADGSEEYLTDEKDLTTSFIALSENYKNVSVACTIHNPTDSLRWEKDGKRENENTRSWIQHRDNQMIKIYQEVYRNATVNAGEVFKFSGTYRISEGVNMLNIF